MRGRIFVASIIACMACALAASARAQGPAGTIAVPASTPAAASQAAEELAPKCILGDPAFRHDNTITKGMILSDGRRMVTSGNDGTARLWDLPTGKQLQCYRHTKDYVWDFQVPPGDEKLLTSGAEAKAILWDLKTGRRLAEFPHSKMTFRLALDAGGSRVAVSDQAGYCNVWDLASKESLARLGPGGDACIYTVVFGRDGNTVIGGFSDSTIRAWGLDANSGGERLLKHKDRKLKLAAMLGGTEDTEDIHTLAPSPDGRRIVVCCSKRGPWLMDASTGKEIWKTKDVPSVLTAAWSPEGNSIAVSGGKQLWVLDAADGSKRWKIDTTGGTHYGVAWSPDGNEILCGSENLLCRFVARGADEGKRVYPPEGAPLQQEGVSSALPSPDGSTIYESGSSAGIRVWDRAKLAVKDTWLEKEEVRRVALSADGNVLAAGAGTFIVALDTRTGKEIHRIARESEYGSFALTPDGKLIIVAAEDGGWSVCRVADGQKVASLAGSSGGNYNAGIAISGDMEVAIASGGKILIYALAGGGLPGGELLQEIGGRAQPAVRTNVAIPQREPDSDDEGDEQFAGCAFLPGQASSLITWSNKHLQAWTPTQTEANALTAEEVTALIAQLGANSFRQREAATVRLVAAGRAVLPLLRAAQATEAEQVSRLDLVQKQILAASKLRAGPAMDLKEGSSPSFALHPDGRHWVLLHGSVPDREILVGELTRDSLREVRTFHTGHAPNTAAFDSRGELIVGNCNGTVSIYALPLEAASQPASAPK